MGVNYFPWCDRRVRPSPQHPLSSGRSSTHACNVPESSASNLWMRRACARGGRCDEWVGAEGDASLHTGKVDLQGRT
jgi:hypothetical protein